LPDLLSYLKRHDTQNGRNQDAAEGNKSSAVSGGSTESEEAELIENTGVAVNYAGEYANYGEYAYHIGENEIQISRLDGKNTRNVGSIDIAADGIFICGGNLLVISQFQSGGDEINKELSAAVTIYDITIPDEPVLKDEYVQQGELIAYWMVASYLYLVTGDGVCACGWSRLEDVSDYYPALQHNGETQEWGDEDISILGEPTRVQYSAFTVIDGHNCTVVGKEALYGDVLKIFYGVDWVAATVAGETDNYRENPVLYTFDGNLNFTGKINASEIMNVPEGNRIKNHKPENGDYLSIVSVANQGGIYRLLGTYTKHDGDTTDSSFMAISANVETGKAGVNLLSANEGYPYGSFTEIVWEDDKAIICVGIIDNALAADMERKTRFIFAEFDGLNVEFRETELTADYLDGRVGTSYGNPMGNFKTLISMGQGIYIRYSNPGKGPGGFDIFDFSDSAEPKLIYRAAESLSGDDAFDYMWYVYNNYVFGTLKVILGEEDYFRDVKLAWCVYSIGLDNDEFSLQYEYPLECEIETFFGADDIGFVIFRVGDSVYYATKTMDSCVKLRR